MPKKPSPLRMPGKTCAASWIILAAVVITAVLGNLVGRS
jgi:hypothetical protein